MKKVSHTATLVAKDAAKVCMHVLGVARTDFRVMREATALIEAGFSVSIVDIEGEAQRPATEDIQGICVRHVLMPGWYISTRFPWSLLKAALMFFRTTLRLVCTSADIYHAHDECALPACYIAARLHRKPLVFDAHELPLCEKPLSQMSVSQRSMYPLLTYLFLRMLPYCAKVITTSPLYAKEIRRSYNCLEVSLIRNFPVYRSVPKSNRLREHFGLSPDVRIALYQGYIQPDRGMDRLVRAAPYLEPDIVVVMMGKGDNATLLQLESLIASEEVADRVKIMLPVPYEELLDWTASADIGLTILPPDYSQSIRMTLPNKLFEYLMAGLPVLTSPLDAIVEVIKTYDVGQIVSSLAPEDVGAGINVMLSDQVALARMSRNALEAARHEFHWEKESQQLIGLYRDILRIEHADPELLTPYA